METENRLIDANVVLEKKFTTGLSDASGNYYGYADVVFADDIENAPTVDAVKVVRCWECKHRDGIPGQPNIICSQMHDDDFCSYGERKDGDDDG